MGKKDNKNKKGSNSKAQDVGSKPQITEAKNPSGSSMNDQSSQNSSRKSSGRDTSPKQSRPNESGNGHSKGFESTLEQSPKKLQVPISDANPSSGVAVISESPNSHQTTHLKS